jgi:hypothetical protein
MRSLRSRLVALWLMLAVSGMVTGALLIEFYRQSTSAQVGRAEEAVARSCRELTDRYQSFADGWRGRNIDDAAILIRQGRMIATRSTPDLTLVDPFVRFAPSLLLSSSC